MANGKQKLELTWIGKDIRPKLEPRILIEDPAKSYHAEFRTSQTTTSHKAATVGRATNPAPPREDFFDNRLIFGDNLLALKALELSRGASKPATQGRNSGVQNQPLVFYLITSNNLSCQGPFWTHIRLMFGTDRRSSGVRLHLALRYRCCHAWVFIGSSIAFP